MKEDSNNIERTLTLDGLMTFGKLDNGLHIADFQCCQTASIVPLTAQCKVQIMRDGNVYLTELPKRVRNKALFRDDNCSLSLGQNGRYYFVFSLPQEQLGELPAQLTAQAGRIAQKVIRQLHKDDEA